MRWRTGLLAPAAIAAALPAGAAVRSGPVRDVEGYAVATCLARQPDARLREQGEGWASNIVQRGHGDVNLLHPVQLAVEAEIAKGGVAVIRQDGPTPTDLALPIMHCVEMVDRPAVRAAIGRGVARLGPAYRRR